MDQISYLQPDVSSLESSDEGNKSSGDGISFTSGSESGSGTGSDSGSGSGSDSRSESGSDSGSGSDSRSGSGSDSRSGSGSGSGSGTGSDSGSGSSSNSRSGSRSSSDSGTVNITDTPNDNISLEHQTHSPCAESTYLIPLHVFGSELYQSEASDQSTVTKGFERRGDNIHPHSMIIQDKITAALRLLTFREHQVLVQLWSPNVCGKHQIIITDGQPFGLGVVDGQFSSYKKDSKHNLYVVDDDHEECLSPPARVYSRGLPEWTSDVANYSPKHFPQKEHAIRCNVHGYLALPIFDLFTRSCVGVLEILTTTKFSSYAYQVQQVQSALETTYLTTAQAFDCPTINVNNEHTQNELEKISSMLKLVCDTHRLPLAQTWAMSPLATFASHEQILKRSCNSFHTRCLGKDCIATNTLPFYDKDSRLGPFRKACGDQHLDRSTSFVGKTLLSRGSCFCDDITKLSVEEYPLAQFAQTSGLTSCFVIFLHSTKSNEDYVLEFFLPLHKENGRYEQQLVQTLKHGVGVLSEFELGDSIQVVGPIVDLSSNIESATIQTSPYMLDTNTQIANIDLNTTEKSELLEMYSLYLDSIQAKPNSIHVENKLPPQKNFPINNGDSITDAEITDAGEKNNHSRRDRKRKSDSLTMEAVKKHAGKPIDEAAKSLRVSRSTLKRFCRKNNMRSWPLTTKHAMQNRDQLAIHKSTEIPKDKSNDDWEIPELNSVVASSLKQIMASVVSDARKITVKATYKDEMIKFYIPVSSGMVELNTEVVRRLNQLKSKRFVLKYRDEDDDLIQLASDADWYDLQRGFSASDNRTIKLIIQTYD